MFAVPGWNLSAPLKTESEAARSPAAAAAAAAAGGGNNSKKRKRPNKKGGNDDNTGDVTSENVADMWAEVVEGTATPKKSQQAKDAAAGGPQKMRSQKQEYKAAQKLEMQAKQQQDKEGKPPKSKKQRREEDAAAPKKEEEDDDDDDDDGDGAAPAAKGHDASKQEAKGKKQKKKKKDKQHNAQDASNNITKSNTVAAAAAAAVPSPLPPANTKLTPLQAKMREKLASARFRHLNQTLYTTPSAHSLQLIEDDPQIFAEYHAGFRQQVAVWPENPVDTFVELVQRRGAVRGGGSDARKKHQQKKRPDGREEEEEEEEEEDKDDATTTTKALKPLPRDFRTHVCTIADLGCGDAKLSAALQGSLRKLKLAVLSFDLAAPSALITKADISALPLRDGSVDVAIFCLALMGTNWPDFVDEAYRVLRWKGELWVAEIKSRFARRRRGGAAANDVVVVDHSVGKRRKNPAARHNRANRDAADAAAADDAALAVEIDGVAPAASRAGETDVSAFVAALRARGFVLDNDAVDLRNKMFARMHFVKAAAPTRGKNVRGRDAAAAEGANRAGATWKAKAKKTAFVDEQGEGEGDVDEAALLKPCVYKLR